ncbi:MAG: hypothetical protein AAFR88_05235 [Pseudomonadota bacterium]
MKYPALWCAAAATLSLSPVVLAASPDAAGVATLTPAEAPPEALTLPTLIGGDLAISDFEESIAAAMTGGNYRMGYIWGRWRDQVIGEGVLRAWMAAEAKRAP